MFSGNKQKNGRQVYIRTYARTKWNRYRTNPTALQGNYGKNTTKQLKQKHYKANRTKHSTTKSRYSDSTDNNSRTAKRTAD